MAGELAGLLDELVDALGGNTQDGQDGQGAAETEFRAAA